MKKVAITKIYSLPEGRVDPFGNRGRGPIATGHRVEGMLYTPIAIGQSVIVLRERSNEWVGDGLFRTSPVTSISDDGKTFTTQNSRYSMEDIHE